MDDAQGALFTLPCGQGQRPLCPLIGPVIAQYITQLLTEYYEMKENSDLL